MQYETEKHNYDKILKSLKVDNDSQRKKYKSLNKKKVLLIITEILIRGGSTTTSSSLSIFIPSTGIVILSNTALITGIAILRANKHISKLKIRYTIINDRLNINTLLYDKTLKTSMVDKRTGQKEAEELKKVSI